MKINCIVLSILLIVSISLIADNDFYHFSIRENLTNYSNPSLPSMDLILMSVKPAGSVNFFVSLYNLEPFNFHLKIDSLSAGQFSHRFFFGDRQYRLFDYPKLRIFEYSMHYRNLILGFLGGQSRDMVSVNFPSYNHNRGVFASFLTYNFSNYDSTTIYGFKRYDDDYYNEFTDKTVLGIAHNSIIGSMLDLNLNMRQSLYSSPSINRSKTAGNYNAVFSVRKFSLGLSGRFIPEDYISPANLLYTSGSISNRLFISLRAIEALSLYGFYSNTSFSPNDSLSYNSYGFNTGINIPVLPSISGQFRISQYTAGSALRNRLWRIIAYKRISPLTFQIGYSDFLSDISRSELKSKITYNLGDGARLSLDAENIHSEGNNDQRIAASIAWKPTSVWTTQIGMDYNNRENLSYIGEYMTNTFSLGNTVLSSNTSLVFRESFFFRFNVNLSTRGRITDFHFSGLKGRVFYDRNSNGRYDEGEPPLQGATVLLNDSIKVKTDANGGYSFYFMKPGEYELGLETAKLPAYFDVKSVNLELRNLRTMEFDIPVIKMSSINGYVFEDYNSNGIREPEEPGIPRIYVKLRNTDRYTYTDNNGYYIFSNLAPGNYIVEVPQLPEGYQFSIPGIINYVSVKDIKADYTVDFGITKESKPVREKVF